MVANSATMILIPYGIYASPKSTSTAFLTSSTNGWPRITEFFLSPVLIFQISSPILEWTISIQVIFSNIPCMNFLSLSMMKLWAQRPREIEPAVCNAAKAAPCEGAGVLMTSGTAGMGGKVIQHFSTHEALEYVSKMLEAPWVVQQTFMVKLFNIQQADEGFCHGNHWILIPAGCPC